jgi:Fic family protein
MRYFNRYTPDNLLVTNRMANMLSAVAEYKGKQALYTKQMPEQLEVLRQAAVVQSTESSNRIEQVTAAPGRLLELMKDKSAPRDRSEQEIVGYRKALDMLHASHPQIEPTENVVKQLHGMLFWYDGYVGGKYKITDNEIRRKDGINSDEVVFRPTPAYMTTIEMDRLHQDLKAQWQTNFNKLLLTASYVLDLLCIHPFSDGNGRVARLMSLLLLYRGGHQVGAYISLEKIIEQSKEQYYETLNKSSQGWHQNQHDLMPWAEYFIGVVLLTACLRFEVNLTVAQEMPSKSEAVINSIRRLPKYFKFIDLQRMCPHVSDATIKATLASLKKKRLVKCAKRGRDATWEKATSKFWNETMPEDESNLFWGRFDSEPFWSEDGTAPFWKSRTVETESK